MPTLRPNDIQTKLTKEQKEAVGVLSFGTFLEYFDLMLYVHMAVLLNEIFFPKTDPYMTQLLAATTFCTTYVFRPFGALLIGYIGDTVGRKLTVILTGMMMAVCCIIMANAPTYSEKGLAASVIMMLCRILQGLSSMGEVVGALLYLTESVKPPARYPAVALIPIFCALGTFFALGIATLVTLNPGTSWRVVFWIGTVIAGFGFMARTALRETPDFVDAKKIITKANENNSDFDEKDLDLDNIVQKESYFKSSVSLFLMECTWPMCFYVSYVYCGDLLKSNFGYSAEEVINQNLYVSLIMAGSAVVRYVLCFSFHPLIIVKYHLIISMILYIVCPFWLNNMGSGFEMGVFQVLVIIIAADSKFASSTMYSHFPVLQRFKMTSFLYALSRAITYVLTSFGLVYLTYWAGNFGIAIALIIAAGLNTYGLNHFMKLERASGYLKTQRI